jgi:hypothetical protein
MPIKPKQPIEPLAYSPVSAAIASDCGVTKIYDAMRDKELPARKLGTRTFILKDDLLDWLKSHEVRT